MTLEEEISFEFVIFQQVRIPELIVQPHLLEGNLRLREPLRPHLFSLSQAAQEFSGLKDVNLQNNGVTFEFLFYQSHLVCNKIS